jgi:hypothetical protein
VAADPDTAPRPEEEPVEPGGTTTTSPPEAEATPATGVDGHMAAGPDPP